MSGEVPHYHVGNARISISTRLHRLLRRYSTAKENALSVNQTGTGFPSTWAEVRFRSAGREEDNPPIYRVRRANAVSTSDRVRISPANNQLAAANNGKIGTVGSTRSAVPTLKSLLPCDSDAFSIIASSLSHRDMHMLGATCKSNRLLHLDNVRAQLGKTLLPRFGQRLQVYRRLVLSGAGDGEFARRLVRHDARRKAAANEYRAITEEIQQLEKTLQPYAVDRPHFIQAILLEPPYAHERPNSQYSISRDCHWVSYCTRRLYNRLMGHHSVKVKLGRHHKLTLDEVVHALREQIKYLRERYQWADKQNYLRDKNRVWAGGRMVYLGVKYASRYAEAAENELPFCTTKAQRRALGRALERVHHPDNLLKYLCRHGNVPFTPGMLLSEWVARLEALPPRIFPASNADAKKTVDLQR
jgi:hypothetical protein